ncbi:hypothetical protein AO203_11840 (plasmid) [Lactobacillus gallinarum]|nr:hypothetical protein AO203_11810 [Lactobacillus gallinarum]ALJ24468.1 hypothetical protein AO203_11840 [Lactobacillus gallinarum]
MLEEFFCCVSGEKAFAVICTNTNKKADVTSIFILLGHYLQAKIKLLNQKIQNIKSESYKIE